MKEFVGITYGTHFWAKLDGKLVMMCKCKNGIYVCGEWEDSIYEEDIIVIKVVDFPEGYTADDLYYQ